MPNSFKEMITNDLHNVFLNPNEFGEKSTVVYNENTYEINIVLDSATQKNRGILRNDHAQGIYRRTATMYAAYSDLQCTPKYGQLIWVNDVEYRVDSCTREGGALVIGLGAFDA